MHSTTKMQVTFLYNSKRNFLRIRLLNNLGVCTEEKWSNLFTNSYFYSKIHLQNLNFDNSCLSIYTCWYETQIMIKSLLCLDQQGIIDQTTLMQTEETYSTIQEEISNSTAKSKHRLVHPVKESNRCQEWNIRQAWQEVRGTSNLETTT